jgi:hypothetical protein
MKDFCDIDFDGFVEKLSIKFDTNPYDLSKSQIDILKWFSENPGYLKNSKSLDVNGLIRTDLVTRFVKRNLKADENKN